MKHRTAQGKMIDMATLRAKNESVRAVGNMNVNSKGDIIDSHDNVIDDVTRRVNQHYMNSVQQRMAQSQQAQQTQQAQTPVTPAAPTPAPHASTKNTKVKPKIDEDIFTPPDDIDDDVPNPKK
jgi:hypothetical protein